MPPTVPAEMDGVRKAFSGNTSSSGPAVKMPSAPELPPMELINLALNPQVALPFPKGCDPRRNTCTNNKYYKSATVSVK